MMTKEQHIKYWVDIAADDWRRKEILFNANDYVFCVSEQLEKVEEVRICLLKMLQ